MTTPNTDTGTALMDALCPACKTKARRLFPLGQRFDVKSAVFHYRVARLMMGLCQQCKWQAALLQEQGKA